MAKSMIDFGKFDSLISVWEYFTTDDVCKKTITEYRWGAGDEQDIVCPYCGKHHCSKRSDGRFICSKCQRNFSCTVGTIFENTKVSLRKWFAAMYLISFHKKGISSYALAGDIKVTQKTAWYMLQKIRTLYAQDDTTPLCGDVECDEVYIGGKEKWKHKSMHTPKTQGRSTKTKTPVFGMMERTEIFNEKKGCYESMTYIKAVVVEKTDSKTLLPVIGQFVTSGSHVITDELGAYKHVAEMGYTHSVVNHGAQEFVNGSIFTNNLEGFWGHFRRMITGCYHDVSDKYLQRYVDEACFRWNTRKTTEGDRFKSMFLRSLGIVRYSDVTSIGMVG